MYCRQCGAEGDTRFCGSCGRPMEELPAELTPTHPRSTYGYPGETAPPDMPLRAAHPEQTIPRFAASPMAVADATNVTVNVAGPQLIYQDKTGPSLVLRALWFIFIGWYVGFFWILTAGFLNATIIGLPLGLMMFNAVPKVMTLKSRNVKLQLTANADGTYDLTRRHVDQRPFWLRAVYFVLVGWWFSITWALAAYTIGLLIITLPISFWMFDRVPALTTLSRY